MARFAWLIRTKLAIQRLADRDGARHQAFCFFVAIFVSSEVEISVAVKN
jgi:hypothetical protein